MPPADAEHPAANRLSAVTVPPEPEVLGFIAALRASGLAVPIGSSVAYTEALSLLEPGLDSLYWAGRATLTSGPADIERFDAVFAAWWLGLPSEVAAAAPSEPVAMGVDDADGDDDEDPARDEARVEDRDDPEWSLRFSAADTLRDRDFAELDAAERAEVLRLLGQLPLVGDLRRSRRRRPSRSAGTTDLRRTIRASMRTGGEPLRLERSAPTTRPRRVVLIADISGSMALYSRMLLQFAHLGVASGAEVEVFALGTRLTRLTRELTTHDPDAALARAAAAVPDWSGGTRLGEGLRRFNDEWGVRGLARGAIVVILSDGWDRGDPAELAGQMARLQRVARRIVWVNPLKAGAGYEPTARGMAAALPFVDRFIEGHSLGSLEELVSIVRSEALDHPVRHPSTPRTEQRP